MEDNSKNQNESQSKENSQLSQFSESLYTIETDEDEENYLSYNDIQNFLKNNEFQCSSEELYGLLINLPYCRNAF